GPGLIITVRALAIGLAGLLTWFIGYGLRSIGVALTSLVLKIVHPSRRGLLLPAQTLLSTLRRAFGIRSHKAEQDVGDVAKQFEPSTADYVAHLGSQAEYAAFTLPIMMGSVYGGLVSLRDHTIPRSVDSRTKTTREHAADANARAKQAQRGAVAA